MSAKTFVDWIFASQRKSETDVDFWSTFRQEWVDIGEPYVSRTHFIGTFRPNRVDKARARVVRELLNARDRFSDLGKSELFYHIAIQLLVGCDLFVDNRRKRNLRLLTPAITGCRVAKVNYVILDQDNWQCSNAMPKIVFLSFLLCRSDNKNCLMWDVFATLEPIYGSFEKNETF